MPIYTGISYPDSISSMTALAAITTLLFVNRLFLFIVFAACLSFSVVAQSETNSDSVSTQPHFSSDTVQAIHQLFANKRQGATIVTGVGVTVAAGGVLLAQLSFAVINSVQTTSRINPPEPGPGITSIKLSLPGLFITTLGIIKRVRFSRSREERVISAYEQGRCLPLNIQQLLRAGQYNR